MKFTVFCIFFKGFFEDLAAEHCFLKSKKGQGAKLGPGKAWGQKFAAVLLSAQKSIRLTGEMAPICKQ